MKEEENEENMEEGGNLNVDAGVFESVVDTGGGGSGSGSYSPILYVADLENPSNFNKKLQP